MIHWLDLLIEGDPHPRRFDQPATIRAYLSRIERLSDEAITELLKTGLVAPPLARRSYRLKRLHDEAANGLEQPQHIQLTELQRGPVVAIPIYAGLDELELALMVAVCHHCGGEQAVRTVHRSRASITSAGGLVITPHLLYAALPEPAALLIPGGPGAAMAARDPLLRQFLSAQVHLPFGVVGSGLLLCAEAGLLSGRRLGAPAELLDVLWGFQPADLQADSLVHDQQWTSSGGGLSTLHTALSVASAVWGEEAALKAARALGQP